MAKLLNNNYLEHALLSIEIYLKIEKIFYL
jgi:hypothetical protein